MPRVSRLRRQRSFFADSYDDGEKWYDLIEDYELIEASFAQQYGIRLRYEDDMQWEEFCSLLAGLNEKTPLGRMVNIRCEDDPDMLKAFTPEMRRIRAKWRSRNVGTQKINRAEYDAQMKRLAGLFRGLAGD